MPWQTRTKHVRTCHMFPIDTVRHVLYWLARAPDLFGHVLKGLSHYLTYFLHVFCACFTRVTRSGMFCTLPQHLNYFSIPIAYLQGLTDLFGMFYPALPRHLTYLDMFWRLTRLLYLIFAHEITQSVLHGNEIQNEMPPRGPFISSWVGS